MAKLKSQKFFNKLNKISDTVNEAELIFKSAKSLADFVNEVHKGTSPINTFITSNPPKIDYPNFLINMLKKSMLQNKNIKLEKYAQKKFGQRFPNNRGQIQQAPIGYMPYGNYGQNFQQNYLPQMQNPQFYQNYPQNYQNFGSFPQFIPQQAQYYQQVPQNQFYQLGQQFQQNVSQRATNNTDRQETKKIIGFVTLEDIKGKKQEFSRLKSEDKATIFRNLLEQKLATMKDLIPEFFKKGRQHHERKGFENFA